MKHFLMDIPPWNRKILVVVTTKRQVILDLVKKYKMGRTLRSLVYEDEPILSKADYGATYIDYERGRYILWFPKWRNSGDDMDTLLHETNHVVKHLMKHVGSKDDETMAYCQEWLFSNIRKKLKR